MARFATWFTVRPSPRLRVAAAVVIAIMGALVAWNRATCSARLQQPAVFPDSIVYLQTARQPPAFDQLFYPKPIAVPAAYHAVGADLAAIARLQLRFAIVAWTLLGLALCASVRRLRARIAVVALAFGFLLAPVRIGLTSVILSESIADSLAALVVACGLALALAMRMVASRRRTAACWAASTALATITTAWILTRDTNAIGALTAVAIGAALWRAHRRWREAPWAVAAATAVVLASGFAMWTAHAAPDGPTQLTVHVNVPRELSPRVAFPTLNNIMLRVLPDASARMFFVERGLPLADELRELVWDPPDPRFYTEPRFAPARAWIVEHGGSVYLCWLLAHPLDRGDEFARQLWRVLAPTQMTGYMPKGWIYVYGFPGWAIRRVTTSELVLLVLLLALPFALRRPTQHVTTAIAALLVGSGVLGAAAAYYGDAFEPARHMFGAGQQIVLGLFLAPLAWLDSGPTCAEPSAARGS